MTFRHDADLIGRYRGHVWKAARLMPGFRVRYRGATATLPTWRTVVAWIRVEAESREALR